jgi:hypothetical protein
MHVKKWRNTRLAYLYLNGVEVAEPAKHVMRWHAVSALLAMLIAVRSAAASIIWVFVDKRSVPH